MSDKEEQAPPPAPEAPKDVEGKKEDKKEEKKEEKKGEDGGERNDFVKFANKVAADSIGNWFQADKFEVHHHHHHADPINERPEKWRRYNPGASDFDFVPDGAPKEVAEDIPVSPEQFDDWFYVLSDYERCFVLVMAALHGRRVSDVVERAKQLYTPFRAAQQKQDEKNEQEIRISRNKLEKRLFIMTRRGSGIDRFYWQDTDANRDSEFSMRLVHYIAGEAALGFGVSNGYSFYEQLCQWVNDNDTDIACRAAKALGVFWWKNSTKVLENEIDKWARSDRGSDWDRAAWCLEGAY